MRRLFSARRRASSIVRRTFRYAVPTIRLQPQTRLDGLLLQVEGLMRDRQAGDAGALQRVREFHPRFSGLADERIVESAFSLEDARLTIAREHGFSSWRRLEEHLANPQQDDLDLPHHERIADPLFRSAVDALDGGDLERLRAVLEAHPHLARQRVAFEGGNYFKDPALLEFVAENPTRRGSLPPNVVEIARAILDAGGKDDRRSVDETLALVASSDVARRCGVRAALIDLLCDYGADPNAGFHAAVLHGEFDAIERLLQRGATLDLPTAAATGRVDDVRRLLPAAGALGRQRALGLAAQHGRTGVVRLLLDAGADPNRYNPPGGHSHATPLHQAALDGHEDVVRLLVERGARTDIPDLHHRQTALGWAEYGGRDAVAEYLRHVR